MPRDYVPAALQTGNVFLGAGLFWRQYRYTSVNHPTNVLVEWELLNIGLDNRELVFNTIAGQIRNFVTYNPYHYFSVTIFPSPDVDTRASSRFRLFHRADIPAITGELLLGWMIAMLISDATLPYIGTRIVLEELMSADNPAPVTDEYGWGDKFRTAHGFKTLPKEWHGRGVSLNVHERPMPDAAVQPTDDERQGLRVNCGPRALLVSMSAAWATCPLGQYIAKGNEVALAAGLSYAMNADDFNLVLERVPMFAGYRIAVWYYPPIAPRAVFCHPTWQWPDGQDRGLPDNKKTLTVLHSQGHWYAVVNQNAFCKFVRPCGDKNRVRRCFACFQDLAVADFDTHECAVAPHFTCDICRASFASLGSYEAHTSLVNNNYQPCEGCGKTVFNGPACFRDHLVHSCGLAPADEAGEPRTTRIAITTCPLCDWSYPTNSVHDCQKISVPCRDCRRTFTSMAELKAHRCLLARNKRYYEPVKTVRERTTWRSHWAYDFETNRARELSPEVFVHEVLSWATQLMLPDPETIEHVADTNAFGYITQTVEELIARNPEDHTDTRIVCVPPDADMPHPSIRIMGRSLESFIQVCEETITRADDAEHWYPTMWAHNGSKFDSKFIFDYYVNGRGYEMAGDKFEQVFGHAHEPTAAATPLAQRQKFREVKVKTPGVRQVEITNVGSKLLRFAIPHINLVFKCSYAHHTAPLRALPKTFGLAAMVQKGEFPYSRLHPDHFDPFHPQATCATGLPPIAEYQINNLAPARRSEIGAWWIKEQKFRNCPPEIIWEQCLAHDISRQDVLDWCDGVDPHDDPYHQPDIEPTPWVFATEMWLYLEADVHVLARVMEAYARKAAELHQGVWPTLNAGDERVGKIVSPLDCGTAAGWAFRMYTTWFMPDNLIYTCKKTEHEWCTEALRGGRTDKRANYVEVTDLRRIEGDSIEMVDFCSLYPSVQRVETFNTYFPTGHALWMKDMPLYNGNTWAVALKNASHLERGALLKQLCDTHQRTGFVKVTVSPRKYATHPVLHHVTERDTTVISDVIEPKLVFANERLVKKIYALPELFWALTCGQVVVEAVHDGLFYDKSDGKNGSPAVFDGYVNWLYKLKDEAKQAGNKGLYQLAKTLLNSLWGKLGQRSYPTKEWVSNPTRLQYLFDEHRQGNLEFLSWLRASKNRLYVEYRKKTDVGNLKSTAPYLAAFVSMWGRLILHRRLLNVHGQRVLYYDTDSALIYMRRNDRPKLDMFVGPRLGDLANELGKIIEMAGENPADHPDAYIREVVLVAPKTYAIHVVDPKTDLDCVKVVCKGFVPSYNNRDAMSFLAMKQLVWTASTLAPVVGDKRPLTIEEAAYPEKRVIKTTGHFQLRSSLARAEKVLPTEHTVDRAMTGRYSKGRDHPLDSRLVAPFGNFVSPEDDTFLSFNHVDKHYV